MGSSRHANDRTDALFTGERRSIVALVTAFKFDSETEHATYEGTARELAASRLVVTSLISAQSGQASGSNSTEVCALWGVTAIDRDAISRAKAAATSIAATLGARVAVAVGAGEAIVLSDSPDVVWSPVLDAARQLAARTECGVTTLSARCCGGVIAECNEGWLGLDPLPPGHRDLLRALAVVDQAIDIHVLASLLGVSVRALAPALRKLESRGLVVIAGRERRSVALAAGLAPSLRSTVLATDQSRLHRAVAGALGWRHTSEHGRPLNDASTSARIAHHLERAGDVAAAVAALRQAAEASGAEGDPAAVVDHLEAAVDLIATAPEKIAATDRADIIRTTATSLGALRGNADPKVRILYERGLAVIEGIDDIVDRHNPARFELIWGRGTHDVVRGNIRDAGLAARVALSIAQDLDQKDLLQVANRFAGLVALMEGRLSVARAHYLEALKTEAAAPSPDLLRRFASDQVALSLVGLAWVETLAGHAQLAADLAARAIARAERLGHPHTELHVLCVLALRAHLIGARSDALSIGERARRLAVHLGFSYWSSWASIIATSNDATLSTEAALSGIAAAVEAHAATGGRQFLPLATALLADALVRADQPRHAVDVLDRVADLVGPGKVELYRVPVLAARARAQARLDAGPTSKSAALAYRIARSQGATLYSCHAAGAAMAEASRGDPRPWHSIARILIN